MSTLTEKDPGTTKAVTTTANAPMTADDTTTRSSEQNVTVERNDNEKDVVKGQPPANIPKSFGFWAIIVALCLTGLLTALEATITSTALPTIAAVLGSGELFIWVINGYYLTMTAFQPLFGQIADIYGRRWPMIISTAVFTLGSGLCGGANTIEMLVAGRLVQGVGAGAINVLIEIIVCDLLPLRERGKYLGIMFGAIALGTVMGPLFGGLIVQHSSWRWVFYINVPIGGAALVVLTLFLKVKSDQSTDFTSRLKRIDWIGNLVFILSMVSILTALSWAGSKYPWSSFRIIVPLVMGFIGGMLFTIFEGSKFCLNPTMPMRLFSNRTSAVGFVLTFIHSMAGIATIYFLPVYFQAVRSSTPARAGIQLLPTILGIIPGAIIAGSTLSKFGKYRPIQQIGFALMAVGFGVLVLLKTDSKTGEWVGYQIIGAVGTGLILPVLLPSIQASLPESDVALSTSTWAFIRSFGLIWGATIPTAAFINRFNQLSHRILDPVVREQLAQGRSYEHATKTFMQTITNPITHRQVQGVYIDAMKLVWYISVGFAAFGFFLAFLMKEVPLRKELETEFGIDEKRQKSTRTDQPVSEEQVVSK